MHTFRQRLLKTVKFQRFQNETFCYQQHHYLKAHGQCLLLLNTIVQTERSENKIIAKQNVHYGVYMKCHDHRGFLTHLFTVGILKRFFFFWSLTHAYQHSHLQNWSKCRSFFCTCQKHTAIINSCNVVAWHQVCSQHQRVNINKNSFLITIRALHFEFIRVSFQLKMESLIASKSSDRVLQLELKNVWVLVEIKIKSHSVQSKVWIFLVLSLYLT